MELTLPAEAWMAIVLPLPLLILLSVMSALLERSGAIRVHHWAEETGGAIRELYNAPARFELYRFVLSVLARLLPINAVLTGYLLFTATPLAASLPGSHRSAAAVGLLLAMLLLALVEWLSRWLVGKDPERALRALTGLLRVMHLLLLPLLVALSWVMPDIAYERPENGDDASDEEIDAFLAVGKNEGIFEPKEEEMMRGVLDFGETRVRSVMTPRIDMVCGKVDSSLKELADAFIGSNHSRLPLYEDSVDQIIGIVHLREVLRALRSEPPHGSPRELIRSEAWFVPDSTQLGEVLRGLQARHQQMAVVVDEYGGTAGLVTLEDLLEEIVGEIVDETDEPPPEAQPLDDGAWLFDGRSAIEELDEVFEMNLDAEVPYETVGGLIFGSLGHVPVIGESCDAHGLRFTVREVEGRRIVSVHVEPGRAAETEVSEITEVTS